jgi:hypothetical protein
VVSDLLRRRSIWFGGVDRKEESMDRFIENWGRRIAVESVWP